MKLLPGSNFLERARAREIAAGHQPKFLGSDCSARPIGGGIVGYDAACDSPARSSVHFQLGARREITRYTRLEILKKVRALEANLGLIRRMKGQVAKYAVGRGIYPVPRTKSKEWNKKARRRFEFWANNRNVCDAAGRRTFWERQRYHAATVFSESESFDAMISSSFSGAPMLQMFDSSEIGSPYHVNLPGFVDGVKVNAANRPISYQATTESGGPGNRIVNTREISARDIIHIANLTRGEVRPVSAFAPSVNCAIDKLDLRALTIAAAKLHEALGVVVKRKSGEAGRTGMTGQIQKEIGPDGKLTEVKEEFFGGANVHYCNTDEDIEVVSSDRPTQNLMEFGNELVRDICNGTELNFEIVWNLMTLGGATARIALADAQWFFDFIQDVVNEQFNQRVWVWWCASMMNSGQLEDCPDPEWWVCDWQGPPKLTADAGRTAQSEKDLLYVGLNNWEKYYNERGLDWEHCIDQRVEELKLAKEKCEAAGIPLEYIFAPPPGTQVNFNAPEAQAA